MVNKCYSYLKTDKFILRICSQSNVNGLYSVHFFLPFLLGIFKLIY